jgi:histidine triad (HIT) family protein
MNENCLFCKMVSGAIKPDLVYQDDKVLAFRDINPQAPTHILVIPKRHVATLNELRDEDVELAGRLLLTARRIAKEEGLAEAGYRTVMNTNADAGQTVFHVHLHLLGGRRMQWPPG